MGMRIRWAWVAAAVIGLFACVALAPIAIAIAEAQSTGSSFGGGSWGGGGGGGGSSWSSGGGGSSWGSSSGGGGSSWSSSSGGGGSSWSASGGGSGGGSAGLLETVVGTALLIVVLVVIAAVKRQVSAPTRNAYDGPLVPTSVTWSFADVTVLQLGIDWRARKHVQQQLDAMARSGRTGTPEGLVALLKSVVSCLSSVELAWLYAGAMNAMPSSMDIAQRTFLHATSDARARFKRELVRAVDGKTAEEETPELRARSHEGEGVVVVTVVVAARRSLRDLHNVRDAGEMRQALRELTHIGPSDFVAMEVIWSPSAENDRMSTAELEAHYPTLKKISDTSIAGRVFCPYCQGPHAAELRACPHCGAPTAAASRA